MGQTQSIEYAVIFFDGILMSCVCVWNIWIDVKTSTWWCWLSSLIGFSVRYSTADLVNCLSVSFQNRKAGGLRASQQGLGPAKTPVEKCEIILGRQSDVPASISFHFYIDLLRWDAAQPKNHHAVFQTIGFQFSRFARFFAALSRWDRFGLQ